MKKFWKYIAIAAMTAVMVPFTACDDDSELGPKDNTNYESNFVYFDTPASTYAEVEYMANGDFMSGLTDPMKLVPVRLTKPAPCDLQIEVAIDPYLVAEYNKEKGTDYTFLHRAMIENPVLTIKKGEYISADTITISFGNHSGFINKEKDLMLPIVVKGAEGLTVSKSARIFLTFSSIYRPNYLSITKDNYMVKVGLMNPEWKETASKINADNAFKLTYAPYEDVTLNIAIDESKVAAYNEANGTNYVFKADAELVSNTITIGTDGTVGSFAINTGDLEGIENEIPYVIPVTITSINGAAVEISGGNTVYVVVKGVGRELTYSKNEYSGSKLDNPIACTVDGKTSYGSYTWVNILDNSKWDYGYLKPGQLMEIDFGKVVSLSSIYINNYSSSYAATGLTLETSADGSKWSDWGEVSYAKTNTYFINLSAAEDVQYIRLVFTGGGNGSGNIDIDGMVFYGSNK